MTQPMRKQQTDTWCRGCLGRDLSPNGEKDGFRFFRCTDCGTSVVNPYPSDEELMDFYSNYGQTGSYLKKKESKIRRGKGRVKRMISVGASGKKFLDIGCSVGYVTVAAHSSGLTAHGIDIDPTAVGIAQENFAGQGTFEYVSIHDVAARGDKYDMAYMSEVIEHVNDPEAFIASVAKVLNTGGLLYLTAPDAGHFAVPKKFTDWAMVCPPNHLTYFTRDGMRRLLARHGLTAEKFQIAFKPGMKVFARKA